MAPSGGNALSAEPSSSRGQSQSHVVLIIAHPDDEIFVSGTLCLLAEKDLKITIVAMTDGESGDSHIAHPQSAIGLAAIRKHELSLSAAVLGTSELVFLGYPDVPEPIGPQPSDWDEPEIVSRLAAIVRERKPELILTHGPKGGYGHPAHKLTHRLVMRGAEAAEFSGSIFSFCGMVEKSPFSRWCDDDSDVLIDVRGFLARRAASLNYHQSQLAFFLVPDFPRTLRDYRSAMLGYALWFTEFGRRRIPIGTATRLFRRYPQEGLVLRKRANDVGSTYFLERLSDDRRIQPLRQGAEPARAGQGAGL